jgi:peptidyl-prolyl cis-trans isomerase SurA
MAAVIICGAGSFQPAWGQEALERIAAIVGAEPILTSELAAQMQMAAIQRGIRPQTQKEIDALRDEVLNQMISEKLFLAEARKDTAIKVTSDEIDQALNEHISSIMGQFESEDQFYAELEKEGLNLRSFQKKLRPEIENQLYKQKLIGSKLSSIFVSRQEVQEFYEKFRDSIPDQPEGVRLAHILITFQPSGGTEDSVKQLAERLRKNASGGADFATLSATYSSGQAGINGGDLGFISRDDVVPEFSRAAFNLQPGEISGVIRTQFGYHIIKCEELAGPKGHFRHILLEVVPSAGDSLLSYKLVDSLINEIHNGADFKELAKIYSADDESRKQGGELGWFALTDLPTEFREGVDSLKEINDIYGPVKSQYGLHILKLLERQEGRKFSFDTDYDRVKEMARQMKTSQWVDRWIEDIKKKTYIEIRPLD